MTAFSVVLAGCGTTGGDNPALSVPKSTIGRSAAGSKAGPTVAFIGDVPQLAGEAGINAALRSLAPSGCRVAALRDDRNLVSFRWVCASGRAVTATFSVADGRQLTLGDLFAGAYRPYLSSTGAAQLQADGASNPKTTDLSAWALTADALQVTFPAGTVSFPLVSLTQYMRHPGPLSP